MNKCGTILSSNPKPDTQRGGVEWSDERDMYIYDRYIHLSIYLSIFLFIYLSIHLFIEILDPKPSIRNLTRSGGGWSSATSGGWNTAGSSQGALQGYLAHKKTPTPLGP